MQPLFPFFLPKKINAFIWLSAHVLHDVSFLTVVVGPRLPDFVKKWAGRASLLAQWLRICLPVQETWVQSLVQEDPVCHEAAEPVGHDFWACAVEPASCACWARVPLLLKPAHPGACAPQQEKPPQWEACSLQLEKNLCNSEDPAQPEIK